jgi:hypothetical protein
LQLRSPSFIALVLFRRIKSHIQEQNADERVSNMHAAFSRGGTYKKLHAICSYSIRHLKSWPRHLKCIKTFIRQDKGSKPASLNSSIALSPFVMLKFFSVPHRPAVHDCQAQRRGVRRRRGGRGRGQPSPRGPHPRERAVHGKTDVRHQVRWQT